MRDIVETVVESSAYMHVRYGTFSMTQTLQHGSDSMQVALHHGIQQWG